MRAANVLFITHGPMLYGAQQSLLSLLASVDRNRINPILLSPRSGPLTEAARQLNIQIVLQDIEHWITFGQKRKDGYFRRLVSTVFGLKRRSTAIAATVRRYDIDLIYTNTVTVLEGAVAARMTSTPHVWHLREYVAGNRDLKALCPDALIPYVVSLLSTQILVNSKALAKAYSCRLNRGKITTVYNGLDLRLFSEQLRGATRDLRHDFHIPEGGRIIVTIGSITPSKGHDLFVKVAAQLSSSRAGLYFVVVGNGETTLVNALKLQVKQAGLDSSFRFVGWRDDIVGILSLADLLLVTSEQEAFGRTVIEAMAARTPVIATRSGGPEEIIIDGETGLLVGVNDPEAMTHASLRILNDVPLAARFIKAGEQRVREVFSIEAYVEKIQSTLLRLTVNPPVSL